MNAVRRFGCKPTSFAPASIATLSHHAPAALMITGEAKLPAGLSTVHVSPCR
jgi:hypothetical protein